MAWRVARSLNALLEQINTAYPRRSRRSDGSIGDVAHSNRTSDHNPDPGGVVRARDYTHDPAGGFDAHGFAERLRQTRDPRIKYVISNGRIFAGNAGPSPWVWRRYTGANKHTQHVHVSVVAGAAGDSAAPWAGVQPLLAGAPIRDVDALTQTSEEDDMPTLDEISVVVRDWSYDAALRALGAPVIDWGDRKTSVAQQSADNAKGLALIAGRVEALSAVVESMSKGQPVDLDAVSARVEAAVAKSLSENVVTVDVTVAGTGGAVPGDHSP